MFNEQNTLVFIGSVYKFDTREFSAGNDVTSKIFILPYYYDNRIFHIHPDLS